MFIDINNNSKGMRNKTYKVNISNIQYLLPVKKSGKDLTLIKLQGEEIWIEEHIDNVESSITESIFKKEMSGMFRKMIYKED